MTTQITETPPEARENSLAASSRLLGELTPLFTELKLTLQRCEDVHNEVRLRNGDAWRDFEMVEREYFDMVRSIADLHDDLATADDPAGVCPKLCALLSKHGLEFFDVPPLAPFDAELHACHSTTHLPGEPDASIVTVLARGIATRGRKGMRLIVRPAQVVVNKSRDPQE